MSLTIEQKEFIITLDSQAKDIVQTSGQEGLLMSLADKIHDIKKVMDALSHDELDQYCEKYDGHKPTAGCSRIFCCKPKE